MLSILKDFLSLIFPDICFACGKSLYKNEKVICTFCQLHLPKTNFHTENDNPISKLFWGKLNIHSAAAFYYFHKEGKVQQLIHNFKYKGYKHIGEEIGRLYGDNLKSSPLFNTVDLIIPVPLHKKKLRKRTYNQSEIFAKGLSDSMGIPYNVNILTRTVNTETQTKKSKTERWENVKSAFEVRNTDEFKGKHILLVDDVITTGATMEACVNVLLKIPETKVSVVAIAFSMQ